MTNSTGNKERWDLCIQRNFPPFGMSTSTHVEWAGFAIGPLTWKRGREVAIRLNDEQMQCFMNPNQYYISNVGDIVQSVNKDFEEALDEYNSLVFASVRVSPGTTREDLIKLNQTHTLMYVLMVIGYDIAGDIKEALEKEVTLIPALENYLSIASGATAVQREREALQQARTGSGTVEQLTADFGYLHQDYLGEPWTEKEYTDALTQAALAPPVTEPFDASVYTPYQQWLITLFKKNLYLYEEGRNAMVRSVWAMKETVAALGGDPQKFLYMTLDEVTVYGSGKGTMITDELYRIRKEAYGVYFEGDTFVEVEGKEEVEKIIQQEGLQKFLEKQTQSVVTELRGRIAFKGYAKGKVRLVFNQKDADLVEEGDILISPMTQVEFLSGLRKCGAIVTDEGGIVCHAAIVAREFGKPCVLATKEATKVFKNGDLVEVDANTGIVRLLLQ